MYVACKILITCGLGKETEIGWLRQEGILAATYICATLRKVTFFFKVGSKID